MKPKRNKPVDLLKFEKLLAKAKDRADLCGQLVYTAFGLGVVTMVGPAKTLVARTLMPCHGALCKNDVVVFIGIGSAFGYCYDPKSGRHLANLRDHVVTCEQCQRQERFPRTKCDSAYAFFCVEYKPRIHRLWLDENFVWDREFHLRMLRPGDKDEAAAHLNELRRGKREGMDGACVQMFDLIPQGFIQWPE